MKLKTAKTCDSSKLQSVKGTKVMKQPKLNFLSKANKRVLTDPELTSNSNKKTKLEENNNESKDFQQVEEKRPTRSTRSSDKENVEVQQNPNEAKPKVVVEKKEPIDKSLKIESQKEETIVEKQITKEDNHEEEEEDQKEKFSNSMKDAVKTECRVCRQPVALTSMRGHTKSAHKMSIGDYKDKFGNHRTQMIEKVYHRCGICQQAVLLDSDDIAFHLKKLHDITHKDYNSKFMILKKDDKSVKKPSKKPWVKPKAVPMVKSIAPKEEVPRKEEVTDEGPITAPNEGAYVTNGNTESEDEEEDDGSGPSSGLRLSSKEREQNYIELFRLQRMMLQSLRLSDPDDEDEEEVESAEDINTIDDRGDE